jgi:glyoxylase-like metal-dependent hydrolase (beta-lactamase superfamily II)
LGVAVLAGAGADRRMPYEVGILADGATIDAGDVPLHVVATPGPRPDHLAFVVGSGAAVLTGDLDGRRGARSIPGPVDGVALTASVRRVTGHYPGARLLGGHPDGPA